MFSMVYIKGDSVKTDRDEEQSSQNSMAVIEFFMIYDPRALQSYPTHFTRLSFPPVPWPFPSPHANPSSFTVSDQSPRLGLASDLPRKCPAQNPSTRCCCPGICDGRVTACFRARRAVEYFLRRGRPLLSYRIHNCFNLPIPLLKNVIQQFALFF